MKSIRTLRIVVVGVLLGSVAANVVLLRTTDKLRKENAEVRLDPAGYSFFPIGTEPSLAASPHRVVFYGDSRAQNWREPKSVPNAQIVNRGIGHQTTEQILERFEEHVAELKPQIIVMQMGVNDLKQIDLFPEKKATIVAACKKNLDTIVQKSRALGSTVVLTTIFPIGNLPIYRRPFWNTDVQAAVSELNDYIRSQKRDGIVVFDTVPLIADAQGVTRSELSLDFLHLNDAGYAALNDKLTPLLADLTRN
jgi:lysophospholipase L1-like esterase